jgi:hypothetical protein
MNETGTRTNPRLAVGALAVAVALLSAPAPCRGDTAAGTDRVGHVAGSTVPEPTPQASPRVPVSRSRPAPPPTPMRMLSSGVPIDADLSIDQLSVSPLRVVQGDRVNVSFRYNNNGRTQALPLPCKIDYLKRTRPGYPAQAADTVMLSDAPCPALGPGQRRQITRSVAIPFDLLISGSEKIQVRLVVNTIEQSPGDSQQSRAIEVRRALDNAASVPITVLPGPLCDLSATALQMIGDPWGSVAFNLAFQIQNTGARVAPAFKYRLTAKGGFFDSRYSRYSYRPPFYTGVLDFRALGPGQTVGHRLPLRRPGGDVYDVVTFIIELDTENRAVESDERNNSAVLTVERNP